MPHLWILWGYEPSPTQWASAHQDVDGRDPLHHGRRPLVGFVLGTILGSLVTVFPRPLALLERSLVPYVVASQTVPILAIAPMMVIWLAGWVVGLR